MRFSIEALQLWLADHPRDAYAWQLLSSTTEAAGLPLRSLRAAAEARAVQGDLNGAIDRMRAAQTQARRASQQDFIEGSVIDLRLRELMAERRERFLAERGLSDSRPDPDGVDDPYSPRPQ